MYYANTIQKHGRIETSTCTYVEALYIYGFKLQRASI